MNLEHFLISVEHAIDFRERLDLVLVYGACKRLVELPHERLHDLRDFRVRHDTICPLRIHEPIGCFDSIELR